MGEKGWQNDFTWASFRNGHSICIATGAIGHPFDTHSFSPYHDRYGCLCYADEKIYEFLWGGRPLKMVA
jgi:hypothetical protein